MVTSPFPLGPLLGYASHAEFWQPVRRIRVKSQFPAEKADSASFQQSNGCSIGVNSELRKDIVSSDISLVDVCL
jgi:hypothetical protein